MWYLVPRLPRSVGLGPVNTPARFARTEQVSRISIGMPRSMATRRACTPVSRPLRAQASRRRRSVEPLASPTLAVRLRHGVPSRRNRRSVASTRPVDARGRTCTAPSQ